MTFEQIALRVAAYAVILGLLSTCYQSI